MAVKIRLKRIGKKKTPFYRIIVSDAKAPVQGKFVDEIGTVKVDAEKAQKWLANGAQPTDTVAKIFKMAGVHKN